MEAVLVVVLVVLGTIVLSILNSFAWGLAFYKCYYWFVLSQFNNLSHFTYIQVLSVCIFIRLLVHQSTTEYKDLKVNFRANLINGLMAPWLTLIIGYLFYIVIIK